MENTNNNTKYFKYVKLKIPIFNIKVDLYVDKDENLLNVQNYFDSIGFKNYPPLNSDGKSDYDAYTTYTDNNDVLILVFNEEATTKTKVLVHEAKHAVNVIFRWCGIELDLYNDEVECYLLEYITDLLINNTQNNE